MMLAGREGTIRFPIPAYLIEHPKGRVLFDTGLHPQSMHDAHGRIGQLANFFQVHFRPGEDIRSRLEQLDIDAEKIDYVINSHLHFDHAGGNELVPNARIIIQRREWEAGRIPETIQSNGYNPDDYGHGHLVRQVEGEFDLFGDGSVVSFPHLRPHPRPPVPEAEALPGRGRARGRRLLLPREPREPPPSGPRRRPRAGWSTPCCCSESSSATAPASSTATIPNSGGRSRRRP